MKNIIISALVLLSVFILGNTLSKPQEAKYNYIISKYSTYSHSDDGDKMLRDIKINLSKGYTLEKSIISGVNNSDIILIFKK